MSIQPVSTAQGKRARQALATHGKTFFWASFFLSNHRATLAATLYLCCRQLDDIADDLTLTDEQRRTLLTQIKNEILQQDATPAHELSTAWLELVQHGIDVDTIICLIDGLMQDTRQICFEQQSELERYSYRVAGTVGIMMCAVLGVKNPHALPFAIDLGIAMQLTNICRDVLEDSGLGRRYLPVDIPIATLLKATEDSHQPAAQAIEAQLANADLFYRSALNGLHYLPRGSRVAIYLAATLYRAIGSKLRVKKCAWWRGRVYLSAGEKLLITLRALPVILSLFMASASKPGVKHHPTLHQYLGGLPHADI